MRGKRVSRKSKLLSVCGKAKEVTGVGSGVVEPLVNLISTVQSEIWGWESGSNGLESEEIEIVKVEGYFHCRD